MRKGHRNALVVSRLIQTANLGVDLFHAWLSERACLTTSTLVILQNRLQRLQTCLGWKLWMCLCAQTVFHAHSPMSAVAISPGSGFFREQSNCICMVAENVETFLCQVQDCFGIVRHGVSLKSWLGPCRINDHSATQCPANCLMSEAHSHLRPFLPD